MFFQSPQYLYFLWLSLLFFIVSIYSFNSRKRTIKKIFEKNVQQIVLPESNIIRYLVRDILFIVAFSLVVLALARPVVLKNSSLKDKQRGIETVFCIDVSNSMLSTDVAPSRIEMAKNVVKNVILKRPNDNVSIIVFAGSAYTFVPMTSDKTTALDFLKSVYPNMISDQGTNISDAIAMAMSNFQTKNNLSRQIVVITDGEDQIGDAAKQAEKANENGIIVNVLGIGTPTGGPIPFEDEYLKDENNNTVITKFNPELCQSIANAGKGTFITSQKSNEMSSMLLDQIEKMPTIDLGINNKDNFNEMYFIFLWVAFGVLVLEFFILERKNNLFKNINLFNREK